MMPIRKKAARYAMTDAQYKAQVRAIFDELCAVAWEAFGWTLNAWAGHADLSPNTVTNLWDKCHHASPKVFPRCHYMTLLKLAHVVGYHIDVVKGTRTRRPKLRLRPTHEAKLMPGRAARKRARSSKA
jgi:hypothetical protein